MICIVCPKGCHLDVNENGGNIAVLGAGCQKGVEYARNELLNPTRTLTTTVAVTNGAHSRLPVKTSAPIPKPMLFDAMEVLNSISVQAPVSCGEVIIKDLLSTGIAVVATGNV